MSRLRLPSFLTRYIAGGHSGLKALGADSLLYGGSRALTAAFALITFPLIARILSPEELGQFALIQMLTLPLVPIALLGQDMAMVRFLSGEREDGEEANVSVTVVVIQVLGILLTVLATVVVGLAFKDEISDVLGWPLFLVALFGIPAGVMFSFVLNLSKIKFLRGVFLKISLLQVVLYTAFLLLGVVVVRFGVYGYTLSIVGALLVASLAGLYMLRGRFRGGRLDRKLGRAMLRFGAPYILVTLLAVLMPFLDRFILSFRASVAEIGVYSVAVRYAGVLEMVVIGFKMAWWPFAFSSYSASGDSGLFGRTLAAYVIAAGCVVTGMYVLSEIGIRLLAGETYTGATAYVLPLLVAGFLRGSQVILGTGIAISGRTFWAPVGSFAGIAVGLVAALALWPFLGVVSAAWGVAAGELIMLLTTTAIAQRFLPLRWNFRRALLLASIPLVYLTFVDVKITFPHLVQNLLFLSLYCALGWRVLRNSNA